MKFIFNRPATVEGMAFEAGAEVSETDLHPDSLKSLRRVGVLSEAPACQELEPTSDDPPAGNGDLPIDLSSDPPLLQQKPVKAEKTTKKKTENK